MKKEPKFLISGKNRERIPVGAERYYNRSSRNEYRMRVAKTGFTLIEILIVIGLLALLSAVVIVAVNPGRQFAQARNAERYAEINTILNAVYQYAVDNNGSFPASIIATATEICKTGAPSCSGLIDLSALTENQKYLVAVPMDPKQAADLNGAGYRILINVNNRIIVDAPLAELGTTISVTR